MRDGINFNYNVYFNTGISSKRIKEELKRLNEAYTDCIPENETIQKCLKHLSQREPYRMLRDWSYSLSARPLPSETAADPPEFTDAERNTENDDIELKEIEDDVIFDLSQKVQHPKKTKLSRRKRNEKRNEV